MYLYSISLGFATKGSDYTYTSTHLKYPLSDQKTLGHYRQDMTQTHFGTGLYSLLEQRPIECSAGIPSSEQSMSEPDGDIDTVTCTTRLSFMRRDEEYGTSRNHNRICREHHQTDRPTWPLARAYRVACALWLGSVELLF